MFLCHTSPCHPIYLFLCEIPPMLILWKGCHWAEGPFYPILASKRVKPDVIFNPHKISRIGDRPIPLPIFNNVTNFCLFCKTRVIYDSVTISSMEGLNRCQFSYHKEVSVTSPISIFILHLISSLSFISFFHSQGL